MLYQRFKLHNEDINFTKNQIIEIEQLRDLVNIKLLSTQNQFILSKFKLITTPTITSLSPKSLTKKNPKNPFNPTEH